MNLPDITYIIRFTHCDSKVELFEHTDLESANQHFDIFDHDDADIYAKIELIAYDWRTKRDTPLKQFVP